MAAPEFDPTKPFQAGAAAAAPEFDPTKPFQAGASSASAPEFDPTKPFQAGPAASPALTERNAVTPEELRSIAAKHGLTEEQAGTLRSVVPYLGARMSDEQEGVAGVASDVKHAVGVAGHALGNIPQFLAKKSLSEPEQQAWDELQGLVDERRTTTRKVVEGGLGLLGAGSLGMIGKGLSGAVATGAAWGAAGGLGESKAGEEASGTLKGAALGAAGGALIHGAASALLQRLSPRASAEVVKAAADHLAQPAEQARVASEAAALQESLDAGVVAPAKHVEEATLQRLKTDDVALSEAWQANPQLAEAQEDTFLKTVAVQEAQAHTSRTLVDFANYLKGNSTLKGPPAASATLTKGQAAVEYLQQWAQEGARGGERLEGEFQRFQEAKASQSLWEDARARGVGTDPGFFTSMARKVFRVTAQGGIIDDRAGTQLEPLWNQYAQQAAKARARAAVDLEAHLEDVVPARKVPLAAQAAWERGELPADSAHADALAGIGRAYEALRQRFGLQAAEGFENFRPHVLRPKAEVMDQVRRAALDVGIEGREVSADAFEAAREADGWGKLSEQLRYLTGAHPETADQLEWGLRQVLDQKQYEGLASRRAALAAHAMQRGEQGMPLSLQEADMGRAFARYVADTHMAQATRETWQDILLQKQHLLNIGDKAGASYVDKWLIDNRGGGVDALPAALAKARVKTTAWALKQADLAERAGDTTKATFLKGLAENADLPQVLMGTMYGNLLGFRPSSMLKPLTASFLSTMPELATAASPAWAGAKVFGGALTSLRQLTSEPRAAFQAIRDMGYMPTEMTAELEGAYRKALEGGGVVGAARDFVQRFNGVALYGMKQMETLARLIAYNSAQSVAKDFMAGSPHAAAYVESMAGGYRTALQAAKAAGDGGRAAELMTELLIGRTLQHYTPAHMSEAGRFLGRIGGAMSTWPTSVAGDAVRQFASKGLGGGSLAVTRKYFAPLLLLYGAQHVLNVATEGATSPEESPRAKELLGSQGLTGLAPIHEAGRAFTLSSPALGDIESLVSTALDKPPEQWGPAADRVADHYTPVLPALLNLYNVWNSGVRNQPAPKGGVVSKTREVLGGGP